MSYAQSPGGGALRLKSCKNLSWIELSKVADRAKVDMVKEVPKKKAEVCRELRAKGVLYVRRGRPSKNPTYRMSPSSRAAREASRKRASRARTVRAMQRAAGLIGR